MATGPLPAGLYCCDTICEPPPGCEDPLCACTNESGERCIPTFQVKIEGVIQGPVPGDCNFCDLFNGVWFQCECSSHSTQSDPTVYTVYNALGCLHQVRLWMTRTTTTFSVFCDIYASDSPTPGINITFEWRYVVAYPGCADFSDTTGSPNTHKTGVGTYPCNLEIATALMRWVA